MLKILKAEDPLTIEQLVICIYSNPGLGKTTLGFSTNSPLLLDFDKGAYRAATRGDSVQIDSWESVTDITEKDLAPYNTIVVDTAGRALDFLTTDIIKRFPKKGYGGALTLQGYGTLKAEFTAWLKSLKMFGKDVVLIAHSSEDKNGDDLIERLDVQGGSKGEIYKSADVMGRLSLVNGKRVLNFSPTDTSFGKNPAGLSPLPVPNIASEPQFLGGIISEVKEKINALSEDQKERQDAIMEWTEKISNATTPKKLNALVDKVKKANETIRPVVKGMIHKHAVNVGWKWENDGYVEKEAA